MSVAWTQLGELPTNNNIDNTVLANNESLFFINTYSVLPSLIYYSNKLTLLILFYTIILNWPLKDNIKIQEIFP